MKEFLAKSRSLRPSTPGHVSEFTSRDNIFPSANYNTVRNKFRGSHLKFGLNSRFLCLFSCQWLRLFSRARKEIDTSSYLAKPILSYRLTQKMPVRSKIIRGAGRLCLPSDISLPLCEIRYHGSFLSILAVGHPNDPSIARVQRSLWSLMFSRTISTVYVVQFSAGVLTSTN